MIKTLVAGIAALAIGAGIAMADERPSTTIIRGPSMAA